MKPTLRAWLIALAAGILAGLLAVPVAIHLHPGDPPVTVRTPGDRIQHAVDGLRRDHFYVGPEIRDKLTDAQFDAIAQAAQAAAMPTYFVWWSDTGHDAGFLGDAEATKQIMSVLGERGYYSVYSEGARIAYADAVGYERPYVYDADVQGRPEIALKRYVEALGAVAPEPPPEPFDYWSGPSGVIAGVFLGAIAYLGVLIVVSIASLFRRSAR